MRMSDRIRTWARTIKREAVALWFAYKHPDTPMLAKVLCLVVVGYALSPIDLIPDFIPVLGYLDDALLLPALIWLAIRVIPADVFQTCRICADEWMAHEGEKPRSYLGAAVIVAIWLGSGWAMWHYWVAPYLVNARLFSV